MAAGDEFELVPDEPGYRILRRGRNLGVWVYTAPGMGPEHPLAAEAGVIARRLGGVLDGGSGRTLVLTIPVEAGFDRVQHELDDWLAQHRDCAWQYTNVYDFDDGETPLGWWEDESDS